MLSSGESLVEQALKIGDIFDDKYKLVEELGAGGSGTVYKALQLDLNRLIALKILRNVAIADQAAESRFLREAKTLNQLSHPNIVVIYHFGLATNQIPFIVMEYLNGSSLRSILDKEGRLPVLRAIKIMIDAARGLAYTHKQNIVHRDLKPENLILLQAPEPDHVKIVDFGLAKPTDLNGTEQKLTATGTMVGTVAYMSPEQCKGFPADARSDVYSLCACFYETITGETAMHADTPVGVMYKHLNTPVPEVNASKVEKFHPILNAIIAKGMAKDAENRYANMDQLIIDLEKAAELIKSNTHSTALKGGTAVALIVSLFLIGLCILLLSVQKGKVSEKTIQISTEQSKIVADIAKAKAHMVHWKNPETIKDQTIRTRYLNDLFALGRKQLLSANPEDIKAAKSTYTQALLAAKQSSEKRFLIASYALRAKSEWKLGDYVASESDFDQAQSLLEKPQDNEISIDILFERECLRVRQRRFAEALTDLKYALSTCDEAIGFSAVLERLERFRQSLDIGGTNRDVMLICVTNELRNASPYSPEEMTPVCDLMLTLCERLSIDSYHKECIKNFGFCEELINKIPQNQEFQRRLDKLKERAKNFG
jgi:serine/threonine protein kinase